MSIEKAIKARLDTAAGLKAHVGNRNYAINKPDNTTYPVTIFSILRETPFHAMGSDAGVKEIRLRVSSFADDFTEVRLIDEQVRAALTRYRGTSSSVVIQDILEENMNDIHHPEAKGGLYQRARDFRVFYEV